MPSSPGSMQDFKSITSRFRVLEGLMQKTFKHTTMVFYVRGESRQNVLSSQIVSFFATCRAHSERHLPTSKWPNVRRKDATNALKTVH